jgi:hypothetical protein
MKPGGSYLCQRWRRTASDLAPSAVMPDEPIWKFVNQVLLARSRARAANIHIKKTLHCCHNCGEILRVCTHHRSWQGFKDCDSMNRALCQSCASWPGSEPLPAVTQIDRLVVLPHGSARTI